MHEDGHLPAKDWPGTDRSLPAFRRNQPCLLTLYLWLPPFTTVSPYNSGWLSHPFCGALLWQPEQTHTMGTGLPFGVMKVFWIWIEVVVAQYCECTRRCWIDFKMVNFVLCDLHLVERECCRHSSKQWMFAGHQAISHCSHTTRPPPAPMACPEGNSGWRKKCNICALDTGPR